MTKYLEYDIFISYICVTKTNSMTTTNIIGYQVRNANGKMPFEFYNHEVLSLEDAQNWISGSQDGWDGRSKYFAVAVMEGEIENPVMINYENN